MKWLGLVIAFLFLGASFSQGWQNEDYVDEEGRLRHLLAWPVFGLSAAAIVWLLS